MPNKKSTIYEKLSQPLSDEASHTMTVKEDDQEIEIEVQKYQYVVNRLNEVLGPHRWTFKEVGEPIVQKSGKEYYATTKIKLILAIDSPDGRLGEKISYGSGVHEIRANALKGALTNALKKAAAMFGVGKEFYEKSYEADYDTVPTKNYGDLKIKKVEGLTKNELSKTKDIEQKLVNVSSAEDLVKVIQEYNNHRSDFNGKQQKYLDEMCQRMKKKYKDSKKE